MTTLTPKEKYEERKAARKAAQANTGSHREAEEAMMMLLVERHVDAQERIADELADLNMNIGLIREYLVEGRR